MIELIFFLLGVLAVVGFLHGTKGCAKGSKRSKVRAMFGGGGPDPGPP